MPRNDQITRQWHLLRRLENSRGRKLAAVDHSVPDGGQGGTLGQGGWLRVPKVMEDTPHGIGMSCPGDFLGVLAAIRPRVLVACLRPGPVGHTASNNVTIRGFHERTFQAAGIGVEQQNVHALISPSRIGPPTSDRTRRFGRRWQRVVTAGEPARPAAGPTVRPGGRSSGRRPVPACMSHLRP
jgi:hypothetical protein